MNFIYISTLFIAGLYSWVLTFLFIYALQILISVYLVPKINIAFIIFVLSFLIYGLRFLLPSIIAGAYSMKTTAVSEWIAAFKKLHLPNWLLIPLAVKIGRAHV